MSDDENTINWKIYLKIAILTQRFPLWQLYMDKK